MRIELLRRVPGYLYNKETRSSFEIEHKGFCERPLLLDAQNRIVDPRFRAAGCRTDQSHIGQTVSCQTRLVRYVCPKPDDLPELMGGPLTAHQVMKHGAMPKGLMLPVSAVMMKNPALYDHSLEAFSNPLMRLVDMPDRGNGGSTKKAASGLTLRPRWVIIDIANRVRPLRKRVHTAPRRNVWANISIRYPRKSATTSGRSPGPPASRTRRSRWK